MELVSIPPNCDMNPMSEIVDDKIYDKLIPLQTGMTVVDIGASIGIFSLYASEKVGASGKVIAFEPEPSSYDALVANTRNSNVIPVQKALWNASGKTTMYLSKVHTGSSLFPDVSWFPANQTVSVDTCRLDEILPEMGVTHVDFIKIDTEGAGNKILEGATGMMPYIDNFAIAAYHAPLESPQKMVDLLRANGFRTKVLRRYGMTPYVYATRDPNLNLFYIESWQIGAIFGLALLGYVTLK